MAHLYFRKRGWFGEKILVGKRSVIAGVQAGDDEDLN